MVLGSTNTPMDKKNIFSKIEHEYSTIELKIIVCTAALNKKCKKIYTYKIMY
jgi:hypothetical protein